MDKIADNPIVKGVKNLADNPIVKGVKNLWELLSLVGVVGLYIVSHIFSPSLDVTYEEIPLYRSRIATGTLADISKRLQQADSNKLNAFIASNKLFVIRMTNNSKTSIEKYDLELRGIHDIADISIDSSSAVIKQKLERVTYQINEDGIATFTSLPAIFAGEYIAIQVWGNFQEVFLFQPRIKVMADVPRLRVVETREVYGLKLFIAENIGFLASVLGFCFFITGARRALRAKAL